MNEQYIKKHGVTIVIKPCPFCDGMGSLVEREEKNINIGYGDFPYVVIVCAKCGASGEKFNIRCFNMFSNYTVEEFRNSNLLRAKEELKYKEYLDSKKQEATEAWNTRKG